MVAGDVLGEVADASPVSRVDLISVRHVMNAATAAAGRIAGIGGDLHHVMLLLLLLIMMRMLLLLGLLLLMVLDFSSRRGRICDDDAAATLRCALMRCVTVDDGSGGGCAPRR